jgi:DNA invertase Pin-like site-specific DNA recombinase
MQNELQSMRIDLMFLQQGQDKSTSSGQMMFNIFGALAEFERNLIPERVIAGQNRAKAKGVKMGSPSKMIDGLKSAIRLLRSNGMGIKQIAREVGVGIGSVYSVI